MNEQTMMLSQRLQSAAARLPYPPTPDLTVMTAALRPRPAHRWRWVLAAVAVGAASLLAAPSVRAKVVEFFQVGAVRVELPSADPLLKAEHVVARKRKMGARTAVLGSILDLNGETSLAEARTAVSFPIELPLYPVSLGGPDHVFLQHTDLGDYAVLAWLDDAGDVQLVQYVIPRGVQLTKGTPNVVEVTEVRGYLAIWTDSEYLLDVEGYKQPMRFIDRPALIWSDGQLTYRLEAELSLEELVRIAESIPQAQ